MATLPGKSKLASAGTSAANTFPRHTYTTVIKEGHLHKRQRGKKATTLKGLKFQKRYCVLSPISLEYYEFKKDIEPKKKYSVEDIKIVEKVPYETFRKPHCFQVGSKKEVIYFCAESEEYCQLWINAFIEAAFEKRKNKREPSYHIGAFGHINYNQWSCCKQNGREAEGCESSTACSAYVELHAKKSLEFNRGIDKSGLLDVTGRHFSIQSAESGYGQSPASRQSTAVSDSGDKVHKRVRTSLQTNSRDSGFPISAIITEEDLPIRAESGPILIYTPKNILLSEEPRDFSYVTTVLYRGADTVISATNTGKVFTSSIDLPIYDTNKQEAVSISVWGKYIAIASTEIYLHNLDDSKGQYGLTQDSPQLVAFSPDGSLFSASKGRNVVRMWSKPKDWAHVNISTRPVSTFCVAEEGDQIFGITVSPHPKNPWLAVVVTSPSSCDGAHEYSVHIHNYTNKHSSQRIDAGLHTSLAFTHDGRHLFIGNKLTIKCLDLDNGKEDVYYTFKRDGSITSLTCSSVRHHLAVGLSTGEVNVFTGHPSKPAAAPHSIPNTKSNGAVTSLSYSRDGMNIAVASNDGNATNWRESKPPKEPAMVCKHPLLVTNKGQTFHSDEDGYTITIPEGAVKEGTEITLHHGVAPHSPYGPFEFDEGVQPVSPILLLCPEPANTVFIKPIEVTLPHFIACETQEDFNKLSFSKARHDNFRVDNSTKIYKFGKVTDGKMIHLCQYDRKSKIIQGAATLYTQHCCYICIQEKISEKETKSKKIFALAQILPKHRDYSRESRVYYCLSYHLKTCLKVLEEQFPKNLYIKNMKTVLFEEVGASQERVLKIQLNSESGLSLPDGWALQMINGGQIAEQNLCFWDDEIRSNIEELCQTKEYPPKIPLRVVPGQDLVTEGVSTMVSFTGVRMHQSEDTNVKFMLELTLPQMPPHNSVFSGRRLSSLSSSYTSHESASPLTTTSVKITPDSVEDLDHLQDQFDDIAKTVDCKKLASALFTESSPKNCPYLSDHSKKKITSFLTRSRAKCDTSDEKFSANYDILVDARDIASEHPQYITAIQAALNRAVTGLRKDGLGINRSKGESVSTASVLSFTAAEDNSPPVQEANLTPPPMPRSTFPTEYSHSMPDDNHSSFILPFEEPPIANPIL